MAHVVLLSVEAAAPDHPMDLMRMKYAAEQDLKASGMTWTIIRPTAYMETWCDVLGRPLLQTGATNVFGRGQNPVNFVAVTDVARLVELAVVDAGLRGETIGAYGPENLTTGQFVDIFQSVTGGAGQRQPYPTGRDADRGGADAGYQPGDRQADPSGPGHGHGADGTR